MPKKDAETELRASLRAAKDLGGFRTSQVNGIVAKNVLHEELGYFGTEHLYDYDLDDETKGRLLAHARQDAAHALVNTSSTLDKLGTILRIIVFFGVLIVVLLAAIVWKLWN